LVIAPPVSAALDEKLRNFSLVEISRDGELRGRSKRTERKGDVVDFDQLARLHSGPPHQIAVVGADQVDLAAVDAALIVDHLHVALLGRTERRAPTARAGIGHRLADLDLAIGPPRRIYAAADTAIAPLSSKEPNEIRNIAKPAFVGKCPRRRHKIPSC